MVVLLATSGNFFCSCVGFKLFLDEKEALANLGFVLLNEIELELEVAVVLDRLSLLLLLELILTGSMSLN